MDKTSTLAKATIDPKDLESFYELLKAVGEKTENLNPEEERVLQNKCWAWIQSGKPAAVLPKMSVAKEVILKVYRVKKLGVQYLKWRNQDGVQGVEYTHTYEQVREIIDNKPTGNMIDNLKKILTTSEKLIEKYEKVRGQELVEIALKTTLEPSFYFVHSKGVGGKIKVDAEDFNGDFDGIVKGTMIAVSSNRK